MKKAKEAAAVKDRAKMCEQVIRGQTMIRELRNALDMSRGEIAEGLYRIYTYMVNRLIKGNLEKNVRYVDEVISLLTDLKKTWLEAVSNLKEKPKVEVPQGYVNIVN